MGILLPPPARATTVVMRALLLLPTMGVLARKRGWTRGYPRWPFRCSSMLTELPRSATETDLPLARLCSLGSMPYGDEWPSGAQPPSAAPPPRRPLLALAATATLARLPPATTLLREPHTTAWLMVLAMSLIA